MLAFAACMRANGVPNFPDPDAQGMFLLRKSLEPLSPAFEAVQLKCYQLVPGGAPAPGATTHPSEQALAQMLRVSQCMQRHGVPNFPDPTSSVPTNLAGIRWIYNSRGVVMLFRFTLDARSPAFAQAAAACDLGLSAAELGLAQGPAG
jgi:hypothetical protein